MFEVRQVVTRMGYRSQRVASHVRSPLRGRHTTADDHMPEKQERIGVAGAGQRGDVRPRGLAERNHARPCFRIFEAQRVFADIPPSQIEHFAAPASGEREQLDRGDGLGPFPRAGRQARARAGLAPPRPGTGRSSSSGSWRFRDSDWYPDRAIPTLRPGTSSHAVSRRRGWLHRACPGSRRRTTRPRPRGRCG